ncbi:MAG: D-isomer specific 2-hydroxyacid dehydrogenase NAD-binding protein [Rhodospirillales bacterium]|nr:D-isomer specific 2-hydroxyacid dehydrogenase NAD-binding protein [Rhodospirillales bacterium]
MLRVAILDDYQEAALRLADWQSLHPRAQMTAFADHLDDLDALAARLHTFEAIVAMRERTPFRAALLERLPNLKLLITTGMRNASIDVAAARARGVTVCGTRGVGTPTAELAWGLILALLHHIPHEDRGMREGRWQTTLGTGLEGKTMGVLGLGRLGSQVAKVAKIFGMRVVAWSQNLTAERAAAAGAELVDKATLFAEADVISIHLVLGDRTRGLVGTDELARMKPTAYLVNTSRGPIVEEAALLDALRNRRIAGAGLDVYDIEPLPADHALRQLPNTVLTPHLGYVTEENYRVYFADAVEDIRAFLDGKPVRLVEP